MSPSYFIFVLTNVDHLWETEAKWSVGSILRLDKEEKSVEWGIAEIN